MSVSRETPRGARRQMWQMAVGKWQGCTICKRFCSSLMLVSRARRKSTWRGESDRWDDCWFGATGVAVHAVSLGLQVSHLLGQRSQLQLQLHHLLCLVHSSFHMHLAGFGHTSRRVRRHVGTEERT